jgi:hypothetical protein
MHTIEKRFMSLRKVNRYWNMPLTSLSDHLTSKITSRKRGPPRVFSVDEEAIAVEWVFGMHECSLSISLH